MFAREFSNLQCLMSEDRGSIYVLRVKIVENRMCRVGPRLFAQLSQTLKEMISQTELSSLQRPQRTEGGKNESAHVVMWKEKKRDSCLFSPPITSNTTIICYFFFFVISSSSLCEEQVQRMLLGCMRQINAKNETNNFHHNIS